MNLEDNMQAMGYNLDYSLPNTQVLVELLTNVCEVKVTEEMSEQQKLQVVLDTARGCGMYVFLRPQDLMCGNASIGKMLLSQVVELIAARQAAQ